MVSHDYNIKDSRGFQDYSEHFGQINKLCDAAGCDTILYALYTWDRSSPRRRDHDAIFEGLDHVQLVVLEVWEPPDSPLHVEVWVRGTDQPLIAVQRFAQSQTSTSSIRRFMDDLPARQFGSALLTICGETNLVSLSRKSKVINDPFQFGDHLDRSRVNVVLNPIHDYMRRPEMKEKRRYFSQHKRAVLSVWNQGRAGETAIPWTLFYDGEDRTADVREIPSPISERPDIRIGVVDLRDL